MNKKLIVASVLVAGTFAVLGVSKAFAYRGDFDVQGSNCTQEREEAMNSVMSGRDFEGWKELMRKEGRNPGVLRKIDSQEKFNRFAEARMLAREGNTEGAQEIRRELGLNNGQGNKFGRDKDAASQAGGVVTDRM